MKSFRSRKTQYVILGCLIIVAVFLIGLRKKAVDIHQSASVSPSSSVTAPAPSVTPASVTPRPSTSPAPEPAEPQPENTEETQEDDPIRKVLGNNVCLRAKADADSANKFFLYYGNDVEAIGEEDGWTEVSCGGVGGYILNEYLGDVSHYPKATGAEICEYALGFVGAKYKWAGKSPETGFDCSGFVLYVFDHFGIQMNRIASDQALNGVAVENKEDMRPGDILLFKSGGAIYHSAIYMGDGQMVHASDEKTGVTVSDVSNFNRAGMVIRRMTWEK